jgi:hypothetical protein
MDDSFEKAAGAALPAKDPLGGVAVGLADPLAESLRRVAEGFGAGRHALDLAAAGVSSAELSAIRDALAGSDLARMSASLRDAAIPSAVDLLRIAGAEAAFSKAFMSPDAR